MENKAEIAEIRQIAQNGSVRKALDLALKLKEKSPGPKLDKLISKLERYLEEYSDDENSNDEDQMVLVENDFYLYKELFERLYPYQIEGVKFLWKLHQKNKGGVIGDDMGLGKTIQVIAFLSGLFDLEKIKTVLLVLPISVIPNWEKEFEEWAPGINVLQYYGTERQRDKSLNKIRMRGGVLMTSYGLIRTKQDKLCNMNNRPYVWDYVILDEAHAIKNPTRTTKAMHLINSKHRVALTGTPIQNNLMELWALFDFVHSGGLLGSAKTFKIEYEAPIIRSREKCATVGQKALGAKISDSLQRRIEPYFLRRTKSQVLGKDKNEDKENIGRKPKELTQKNDFIIWLYLTPSQEKIYREFLELDEVKELLMTKKSPLVQLNILKKICDHPRLLAHNACVKLGLSGDEDEENSKFNIRNIPSQTLMMESNKISFTLTLVKELHSKGHRTLIFSQSRKMLDIIQKILLEERIKFLRLDGTITSLAQRAEKIKSFQDNNSYSVFLLTTQVGGVGITLTAADRVIIIDPSWNPSVDAQAVDRAFRIGQEKPVVVYRLITCSTIEEKIYRRQIFKDSIIKQTTGDNKDPFRYFTKEELRKLFTLENPRYSTTQKQIEQIHLGQRKTYSYLDEHIEFLNGLDIFGISDHDTMFSCQETDDSITEGDAEYIEATVEKAQNRMQKEIDIVQQLCKDKGPREYMGFTQNWENPFERLKSVDKNNVDTLDQNEFTPSQVHSILFPSDANRDSSSSSSVKSDDNYSDDSVHSITDASPFVIQQNFSKATDFARKSNNADYPIVIEESDDENLEAYRSKDDVVVINDSLESLPDVLDDNLKIQDDQNRRRSCSSQVFKRRSMFNNSPKRIISDSLEEEEDEADISSVSSDEVV